jgi:signal transduction histidine kinase/ActR/RegA family two-component response regulator
VGRPFAECFPDEIGRELLAEIGRTRETQAARFSERRIPFPRGARWMSAWLMPIEDANGGLTSVMGLARDVTQRHELAELLSRQHQVLNAVVDGSPVGIMLLNCSDGWVCEFSNPVICRLAGNASINGSRLATAWPSLASRLEPVLNGAPASVPDSIEIELPDAEDVRGGSMRQLSVTVTTLQLPEHAASSALVLVSDVTERRRLEQQVLQADKIDAIGRLAGGIAHDFNNLLTPILGFTEIVNDTLDSVDKRRGDLDEVLRAAKSASALTRQLLTFSRKHVTEATAIDLNDVLGDVESILRRTIGEDVQLALDRATALDHVVIDKNQMGQVIMNLCVNARDAMPTGGRLRIRTANATLAEDRLGARRAIPKGRYVALTIADTGTGMTPEVQKHLFEPFFTTKGVGKGTGLGLSIVYGVVRQSGGYIEISSVPGEGTAFTIYLPRAEAKHQTADDARAPLPTGAASNPHATILVVEDNDGLRRLAERLLASAGYKTLLARDAADALRVSVQFAGAIDLLLTDVVMPGVNGLDLAEQLRARRPATRVLLMSGYTSSDIATHGALSAHTPLLQKPFDRDTLIRAVQDALTGRDLRAPREVAC